MLVIGSVLVGFIYFLLCEKEMLDIYGDEWYNTDINKEKRKK